MPTTKKVWVAGDQVLAADLNGNFNLVQGIGGSGDDGALSVTSGTTTLSAGSARVLIKNYTTISISAGATLTISSPHASGTLLILKSTGNCTIAGTILLTGFGAASATSGNFICDDASHAGVVGNNAVTTTGGAANTGGAILTNLFLYTVAEANRLFRKGLQMACGSGGGVGGNGAGAGSGTGGAGGAGGGALLLEVGGALDFSGTITANGATGVNGTTAAGNGGGGGGGGGGSAGMILVIYTTLTANTGTINCKGGAGGAGGNGNTTSGGGGGGGSGAGSYTAAGAVGGAGGNAGVNGSAGTNTTTGAGAGGGGGGGDNSHTGAAGGTQGATDANLSSVAANTSIF